MRDNIRAITILRTELKGALSAKIEIFVTYKNYQI
jgi:hypothetical protein